MATRMCPACRAFIDQKAKVCPYCNVAVEPRSVERTRDDSDGAMLGGFLPHARFTTMMILLVNTAIYVGLVMMSPSGTSALSVDNQALYMFGAKYTPAVLQGEWWRLITAGFLHGGILHILMSTWVLFDLGAQVEEFYGSSRLLIFYFFGNFFGYLASTLFGPILSYGSTTGIFALIAAMIALGVRDNSSLGSALRGLYIRWAIYLLLLGLLPFFHSDIPADLGAFAAGFGLAFLARVPGASHTVFEKAWRAVSGFCLLASGYGFFQMYRLISQG